MSLTTEFITKYIIRLLAKLVEDYFPLRGVSTKYMRLHRIYMEFQKRIVASRFKGIKVVDEDWDYLVILDACRYDIFAQVNDIPGKLTKVYSLAPNTQYWLIENIKDDVEKWRDVVYISANPFVSKTMLKKLIGIGNPFLHLEEVWNYGWDPDRLTVPPSKVMQATLRMLKRYPAKRMVIHFLQPHIPYIYGESSSSIWPPRRIKFNNLRELRSYIRKNVKEARSAYIRSVRYVLKYVKSLISVLKGRIVVTADHGELFGEYGFYEHPAVYIEPLLAVPWLVVEK